MRLSTGNFFRAIPGAIHRGLKRQLSNGTKTITPEVIQGLTSEERVTIALLEQLLIRELKVKQTRMVVRTIQLIAILATLVITDAIDKPLVSSLVDFILRDTT